MKPSEYIKLSVWDVANEEFVDLTNGVISIDVKSGSDSFQGFWDQPDTGQFVVTTRGDIADPNLNPLITTNAFIQISKGDPNAFGTDVYSGFITDVSVKYNKGQKQIVTINGTDVIGYLNRLIITQDFIDTNITPTWPDGLVPVSDLLFFANSTISETIKNYFYFEYLRNIAFAGNFEFGPMSSPPPAPLVKVEAGKNFYELIAAGMSTGLIKYDTRYGHDYYFIPYHKYDSSFYNPAVDNYYENDNTYIFKTNYEDPLQHEFDSEYDIYRPQLTYEFAQVSLNNGLDRMINSVSTNNTNPATNENIISDPYTNDIKTTEYGPAKLDVQTSFTTTRNPFWLPTSTVAGQSERFSKDILDWQDTPETIIDSVTIDISKNLYYETYTKSIPKNGDRVFVQHKLTDGSYVSGFYVICGKVQRITESNWDITFILRKSEYAYIKNNRGKTPQISLNRTSGTTADTFTASIGNYTTADWNNVESVEWMLNYPFQGSTGSGTSLEPTNRPSEYFNSVLGLDVQTFTTNTVSWTYDDGGVLADYYWPDYGGLLLNGPGNWTVAVWVKFKNGLTTLTWEDVAVSAAQAHADFAFFKDSAERITFTDLSGADTNTWSWNFGDGTTYNGKTPPLKQYDSGGSYLVTLTINNGYDTDTITKQVDIYVYQIPVKYVRLRFNGTVTRPAGETEYPTDLIDTIALVELKNDTLAQTGGIQPFNIVVRTLDKVQDIGRSNAYSLEKIWNTSTPPSGTSVTTADYHYEWVYNQYGGGTPYEPYYTTDYSSTSVLNPMSETYWIGWNDVSGRGTVGGNVSKYRFLPVITNNPDGSQTKTYDFDLIFDYSRIYYVDTYSSNFSSNVKWRYFNYGKGGQNSNGGSSAGGPTFLPGGNNQSPGSGSILKNWPEWGSGSGSSYNQNLKLTDIKIWPGVDKKVNKVTQRYTRYLPGYNQVYIYGQPVDPPLDRYGVIEGKTYLPITISVSDDGNTYRKVGTATYSSGNYMTTSFNTDMPPYSNAPLEL